MPHMRPDENTDIGGLADMFAGTGYDARKPGEAARLCERMVRGDATACPTVSGATTPLGFGGTFRDPVERGFVDRTITTGADAYREEYARGLPARQGRHVDDAKLHENDSPDTGRVRKVLRGPGSGGAARRAAAAGGTTCR